MHREPTHLESSRGLRHYLQLPFSLTPLLLVVIFSCCWVLAIRARLTGLLLDIILFSWFFKYCFAFLDAIVAGAEEPPVLSVEMVNPYDEQRPLALFALLLLEGSILASLSRLSVPLALVLGVALLALLPANVTLLGVTASLYRMLSPRLLARLIRGWGRNYLWVVLGLIACASALYGLWALADSVALLAAGSQLAFLLMFALVGGAVHEHRFALGIDTLTRRERDAARDRREHTAARAAMLDESYALTGLKRRAEAWTLIEGWIARHCPDERGFTEYPALLEASTRWNETEIADRIVDHYLSWLLRRGENGLAVDVLEQRVAANPAFRPLEPARRTRLAELAALAGKRALARALNEQRALPKAL